MHYPLVDCLCCLLFFFFNDTAPTEIYTLSLHDALPICLIKAEDVCDEWDAIKADKGLGMAIHEPFPGGHASADELPFRSEEHTSELQSHVNLVCRLLLEKKKINR